MYEIGQVLFVVLTNKQQIFPMQVIETVTKKTLKGEEVKYCLQAGSDKATKIMLDQLEGEVFVSAEEARKTLIARVSSQINALVSSAEKKAKSWYSQIEESQDRTNLAIASMIKQIEEPSVSYVEHGDHEEDTVVLPDGQIAKIRLATDKVV